MSEKVEDRLNILENEFRNRSGCAENCTIAKKLYSQDQVMEERIVKLAETVEQIAAMLKGDAEWQQEGIISQLKNVRSRLDRLEHWKRDIVIASAASMFIGAGLMWVAEMYLTR